MIRTVTLNENIATGFARNTDGIFVRRLRPPAVAHRTSAPTRMRAFNRTIAIGWLSRAYGKITLFCSIIGVTTITQITCYIFFFFF